MGVRRPAAWGAGAVLVLVPVLGLWLGSAPAGAGVDPVVTSAAAPTSTATPTGPADGVQCGDTLTGEHRLTEDLVCHGVGLTLVGDVTLDLAGHTYDGGGSGVGFEIAEDGGEADVVLRDGVVRGWDTGVFVPEWVLRDLALEQLTVEHVATVVVHEDNLGTLDVTMEECVVTDNGAVLDISWPASARVHASRFERNDVIVALADWGPFEFSDSVFLDNRLFATFGDIATLILVDNDVRGSEEVVADGWVRATLTGNTFVDNDVVVAAASGQREVRDNTFEGNGLALGARAPWMDPAWNGPKEIVGNTFRGNVDAIVTEPGADVSLGDNVVSYSSGWGIYAPGAVDLGGNRAWGNGRSPQCTGVVCAGRRS